MQLYAVVCRLCAVGKLRIGAFYKLNKFKIKKIIVKTDRHCCFLRIEAVTKAIEYEETLMKDRKEGIYNCALWIKKSTQTEYRFVVYHTKTAIVVDVRVV